MSDKLITIQCAAVYIVEGGNFDSDGNRTADVIYSFFSGEEYTAEEAIKHAILLDPSLQGMDEYRAQALEWDPAGGDAVIVDGPL